MSGRIPAERALLAGILVPLGPVALPLAVSIHAANGHEEAAWFRATAMALAGMITVGGLLVERRPRWGGAIASCGILGFLAISLEPLLRSPGGTLAALLAGGWLMNRIATAVSNRNVPSTGGDPTVARARAAAVTMMLVWIAGAAIGNTAGILSLVPFAVSGPLFALQIAPWVIEEFRRSRATVWILLAATGALSLLWAVRWGDGTPLGSVPLLALSVAVGLLARTAASPAAVRRPWWAGVADHPARLLVITFLLLSAVGAVALALPAASSRGESVGLVDSTFTAVSAVCVTGLIVRDTPNDFSLFGHIAILVLIQLGGLGIMTFYAAVFRLLRRPLDVRHERTLASLVGGERRSDLYGAIRRLLLITTVTELIGTVLLGGRFLAHGDLLPRALWRGLFTSISAFCNAGFALQSDSLIPYANDPWILHVVATLIITGGLSPLAILGTAQIVRGRRVALQVRLVLVATAVLLVGGALLIGVIEWGNALAHLSPLDRVHHAWFQSVTARTAGFNSIDLTKLHPITVTILTVWMFIGGSPGGTAGGIKTTTAAVLLLAVAGAVRGDLQARAFRRRLPQATVYKAAAITTVGLLAVVVFLAALQLTQDLPSGTELFEVVSALGTVGLSLGGTAGLDAAGKLIVTTAMFLGRVGPLTLFIFLAGRSAGRLGGVPEEPVDVG